MVEDKAKEQVMKEKYMEFQLIERQIKQVQAQVEQLQSQIADVIYLQQSIIEMKSVKVGKEMLVPIGSGIFVNAELKNNESVLVNVGGGVVVKKSIESAAQLLEKQMNEMRVLQEEREKKLEELSDSAGKIEVELSKMVEGES